MYIRRLSSENNSNTDSLTAAGLVGTGAIGYGAYSGHKAALAYKNSARGWIRKFVPFGGLKNRMKEEAKYARTKGGIKGAVLGAGAYGAYKLLKNKNNNL